jgi:hypothetical protein
MPTSEALVQQWHAVLWDKRLDTCADFSARSCSRQPRWAAWPVPLPVIIRVHSATGRRTRSPSLRGATTKSPTEPITRNFPTLRDKKDFVGVGIFYFGARREPTHIDVALIRCVRASDKARLIRDRNTVGKIAFSRPCCRRSRGLRRRVLLRGLRWRRRLVWIVGLCHRLFRRAWITGYAMTRRRLIIRA